MRRVFTFSTCICVFISAAAQAHPGSTILTTGSGERAAMTDGVSFEETSGVHLFRGSPAPAEIELDGGAEMGDCDKEIEIVIKTGPYRSLRRLRTQGFYSGVAYPSRAYTQGFYSGSRASR